MKNVVTGANKDLLHITEGVQMTNADVSEKPSSNKSKGKDDAQAFTMSEILAIPPPIDNGKLVYICRDKSSTRPPITKNKTSKKKMKKTAFLSKP